jgi:hypothetical protein
MLAALLLAAVVAPSSTAARFSGTRTLAANTLTADTLNAPASPGATGGTEVSLSWTATSDTYAAGHRVYRSSTSGGPYALVATVTPRTTTAYVDSPADGTYYYVISAYYQSWESTNSAEVSATVVTTVTLYLHNNPTPPVGATSSQTNLPLNTTAPSAGTLYNYDTNRDASAGLLIQKGASGASESDTTKFQAWRSGTAGMTIVNAPQLVFWSSMLDFATDKDGSVTVYLRRWNGSSYAEICSGTLSLSPWQSSSAFVQRTITLSGCSYTISAGHQLEVKVIVPSSSDDDMWFAYDTTAYPSRLIN